MLVSRWPQLRLRDRSRSYALCMQHCNLHCSRIVEHGRASRRAGSPEAPQGLEGVENQEHKRAHKQTWLYAMTHRQVVTFCVSICMLNLLSLSLSLRLLSQAIYISHPLTSNTFTVSFTPIVCHFLVRRLCRFTF